MNRSLAVVIDYICWLPNFLWTGFKESPTQTKFWIFGAFLFGFGIQLSLNQFHQREKLKNPASEQLLPADTTPVAVDVVSTSTLKNTFSTQAFLQAWKEVTLNPDSKVTVREVLAEVGAPVKKGQRLATVSSEIHSLRKEYESIEAQLRNIDFNVTVALAKRKFVSENELKQRQLEKRARDIQLEISKLETGGRLVAPISGIVSEIQLKAGDYIDNSSNYFIRIIDPSTLKITLNIPHIVARAIKKGHSVQIFRSAVNEAGEKEKEEALATVSGIAPVVDSKTGSVFVEVALQNPPKDWRPGHYVEVQLVLEESEDALAIPTSAVVYHKGTPYVYRVKKNDREPASEEKKEAARAERIPVQLGLRDGGRVQIISGLQEMDEIVTEGQGSLTDGAKVEIVQ